jgi:hypothetical protein
MAHRGQIRYQCGTAADSEFGLRRDPMPLPKDGSRAVGRPRGCISPELGDDQTGQPATSGNRLLRYAAIYYCLLGLLVTRRGFREASVRSVGRSALACGGYGRLRGRGSVVDNGGTAGR